MASQLEILHFHANDRGAKSKNHYKVHASCLSQLNSKITNNLKSLRASLIQVGFGYWVH